MVEKHIKNLLFEYDCVVIPEFGGFIANYVSAEIHPITHTFLPPSKNIAFNEMLKLNDGLLTSQIASSENISREEALQVIRDFINVVKTEIGQKEKYVFNEIGTLYLNHEQKLQFEPDTSINYLSGSFGLPKLEFKPIERVSLHSKFNKTKDRPAMVNDENYNEEEERMFYPEQPRRSRTRILLAIVVPGLLLLAGGAGYFLFLGDGRNALSSFDPFVALKTNIEAEAPATTEEPVDDSFLYADTTYAQNQDITATETTSDNLAATEPLVTESAETSPSVSAEEWNTASAVAPETALTEVKETSKPVKKEVGESPVAVNEAPESTASIASPSTPPRYYVIIGGFSVEKNAYKLRDQLVAKGNTGARVILPKSAGNLMKVSYTDFDTFNAAAEKAQELKAEYGSSVWVFKY